MALIEPLALQIAPRLSQPLAEVRCAISKVLELASLEQVCTSCEKYLFYYLLIIFRGTGGWLAARR